MRASSAVLTDSATRLWDLVFPAQAVLLGRARAAYVHLDNLIAFSKRDRDGKVDAFLACYLPDEVALLFFEKGDIVNAAVLTSAGRFPAAIPEVLRHIRKEPERGEMAFHQADGDQLAAMYASCQQAPIEAAFEAMTPESVFGTLLEQKFSGLVELISDARVNYLFVKDGRFHHGYFADARQGENPTSIVARLFTSTPPNPLPRVTVKLFPGLADLPSQAPPAMVTMFRQFTWDLVDAAEQALPGEGAKRAEKVRTRLIPQHEVLQLMGGARGTEYADPIVEPVELSVSVAAWLGTLLEELEVIHPTIATTLLKASAREHRYALGAVGFFERLPWKVEW